MVQTIDGKKIAQETIVAIKEKTDAFFSSTSIQPGLAVLLVGDDPASQVYVASKSKKAKECGFYSYQHSFKKNVSQSKLIEHIKKLNEDRKIHGILIQLPLPSHLDTNTVIQTVVAEKDVDGFHYSNSGKLISGALESAFVPCTPAGAMILIETIHGKDLSGLNALVVGRSSIVGKPMAALLLAANATVTIAHSRTKDLPDLCRRADILVAAIGKPKFIKGNWIKPGATIIDVGINRVIQEKKSFLVGDVDYEEACKIAGAITPVPGGVGPMTIAMLMKNTLKAAITLGKDNQAFVESSGKKRKKVLSSILSCFLNFLKTNVHKILKKKILRGK